MEVTKTFTSSWGLMTDVGPDDDDVIDVAVTMVMAHRAIGRGAALRSLRDDAAHRGVASAVVAREVVRDRWR